MEEAMRYLIIEEAACDFPSEVARFDSFEVAEGYADMLGYADFDVAYMVMDEAEFEAYLAEFFR